MKKFSLFSLAFILGACSKSPVDYEASNVLLKKGTDRSFVADGLETKVVSRDVLTGDDIEDTDNDLLVGLLERDFGKTASFGAVVTKVVGEDIGDIEHLKIAAFPNLKVKLEPSADKKSLNLTFKNQLVFAFPILSSKEGISLVDFEPAGVSLEIVSRMLDEESRYEVVASQTSQVNYTYPTLVMDIVSTLVTKKSVAGAQPKVAQITTRWYLSVDNNLSANFVERKPTKGVGYFLASSAPFVPQKIRRFDLEANGPEAKIYIVLKNFPDAMKPAAVKALEEWNDVFQRQLGVRPISYSTVDMDSPLSNIVMAGDPRFNVIEWDMFNAAFYDGLGPCTYETETGRNISCSALIQGPKITLRVAEQFNAPELLEQVFGPGVLKQASAQNKAVEKPSEMSLSIKGIHFDIPAMREDLHDEHVEDPSHIMATAGTERYFSRPSVSAFEYLSDYIQSVVAHEVGHNLGLRHNFMGSVFANENRKSGSIMDYLFSYGKTYNPKVEEYDEMAIAYGYAGKAPHRSDMYCTDEDVYSKQNYFASADCKRFDYTNNPYKFYLGTMTELLEINLSGRIDDLAVLAEMLSDSLEGMAGYLVNAKQGIRNRSMRLASLEDVISGVEADIHDVFCKYREMALKNEKTGAENIEVFRAVVDENTLGFMPEFFSKGLTTCELGPLAVR